MSKAELAKYCLESGVGRVYRPNATAAELQLDYVSKYPFPFSAVNETAPCFGVTYWDTRCLDGNVPGRKLAVKMAVEEIDKKVDWNKVQFISTETTAGVPFAAWLAGLKYLPLVVVVNEPQPYTKRVTDLYFKAEKRTGIVNNLSGTARDYDFVTTGTLEGLAFAAWFADRMEKPMFYMREEPKTYGKNVEDMIDAQVEGLGNKGRIKGKKVFNVDEHVGIQPPHVKRLLSAMEADLGEYQLIWGPEKLEDLKGKYGVHFTDLITTGKNSEAAILALRDVGAQIDYCHFVIKRGDAGIKNLAAKKINAGANIDQEEIIAIASEQGMFTKEDNKRINKFNKNPRVYNEEFLKTEDGHNWIKRIGERGKTIILKGYPHLAKEYGFGGTPGLAGWGDGTR